jgi:hypothetical protein
MMPMKSFLVVKGYNKYPIWCGIKIDGSMLFNRVLKFMTCHVAPTWVI